MLSAKSFSDLASGKRKDLPARCFRLVTWFFQGPYWAATSIRNLLYKKDLKKSFRSKSFVLSVGNLTTGGTGKTPFIEYLCRYFGQKNCRVAILSRGYGSASNRPNDESLQLAKNFPDIAQYLGANRVDSAQKATAEGADLLLLDDGFQHRRLCRDLDIVLLDALVPFGFGHLLPRGLLRESVTSLGRADLVVLTRSDQITQAARSAIWKKVKAYHSATLCLEASHQADHLTNTSGENLPLYNLTGKKVFAFCGLGNPAGFRKTLEKSGCELVGFLPFPDHHHYTTDDQTKIAQLAKVAKAQLIVSTEKDLTKFTNTELATIPLWALAIRLTILKGEDQLHQYLDEKQERHRLKNLQSKESKIL